MNDRAWAEKIVRQPFLDQAYGDGASAGNYWRVWSGNPPFPRSEYGIEYEDRDSLAAWKRGFKAAAGVSYEEAKR